MDLKHKFALSAAAVSMALLLPQLSVAQSMTSQESSHNGMQGQQMAGQSEAQQMVPATAALDRTLDSKTAMQNQLFEARVANTIHLKDGTEIPGGSTLIGKVAADDMQEHGQSKMALCIYQAKLKDGKTIPVKATIVGIYGPNAGDADTYTVQQGDQVSNNWTRKTLGVDQIHALSDVDLHSRIASNNSGVLVSTKKDDFKLRTGTEFALAITDQQPGQQSSSSGGMR